MIKNNLINLNNYNNNKIKFKISKKSNLIKNKIQIY